MNNRALQHISSSISSRTSWTPFSYRGGFSSPSNLKRSITPIQFQRMKQDIGMWRAAIREMELAFYPMRVKAQRMYMDTCENGYVKAVIERYRELTIQRDYSIYQVKDGIRVASNDLTQAFNSQSWVDDYVSNVLDAKLFGYSLISLGDIENDSFPKLDIIQRENIRPDGVGDSGAILTSLVYAIDGIRIEEDPLIDMCNHWIPTKSNRGVSSCGYGLLYNIALYEIHLRNIMEWNADYVEMYGMPIKKGTTRKTGKDRDQFEQFLQGSASNAYALLDKGTDDDIEYTMVTNAGTAWKSYDNLENRLQGTIAQLVLGHTDAMKSTPGKLGGMQAANKDGFNESLIEQAMNSKQTDAGDFVCRQINQIGAPKFRRLGKYVGSKIIRNLIPEGYYFGLLNDKEELEIQRRKNAHRLITSEWAERFNNAGYDCNAKELSEWTGITLTPAIPERKLVEERTNTLIKSEGGGTAKEPATPKNDNPDLIKK